MEKKMEFSTKDFYQAAVLKAMGYQLNRLERFERKFAVFVFEDPNGTAQKTLEGYWEKRLTVEPRTLVESINELKSRIYS